LNRAGNTAAHSVATLGILTMGPLLIIHVDGNFTRARKISPVSVAAVPELEIAVIEVMLPVAVLLLMVNDTTFGNINVCAITS
jgi:hypothetical protein